MKVLQINTVASGGSTARIACDLCRALKESGNQCVVAYGRGRAPADIDGYRIGSKLDFYCHVLRNFFLGEMGFGSRKATMRLIRFIEAYQPDIIHLHNLHGFYLNIELLFGYIKRKNIPVVWTLHDCWAFTGQCAHYTAAGCDRWKTDCHDCPIYRSNYPYSLFKDNSRRNYIRKKQAFQGVQNLTIVTPSNWLSRDVGQSFLNGYPVKVIHNGVDQNIFRVLHVPRDRIIKRLRKRGASIDKPILLGVASVWTKNKGYDDFQKLADRLGGQYQIVMIGVSKCQRLSLSVKYKRETLLPLERTSNAKELALWYNVAAIYVNPTYEDTFPTTNLEALSCGCPAAVYDSGGSAECITQESGVAVRAGDIEGLIQAIDATTQMRRTCSSHVVKGLENIFDQRESMKPYIALYMEVMA